MEFQIAVRSDELDPERLHASMLELRRTLVEETEATVSSSAVAAVQGAKGDPMGTLAVTFLSNGTAVSVFKALEAYARRKQSIDIEIARPDGNKFVLHADDLSPEQIAATQKTFEGFVK